VTARQRHPTLAPGYPLPQPQRTRKAYREPLTQTPLRHCKFWELSHPANTSSPHCALSPAFSKQVPFPTKPPPTPPGPGPGIGVAPGGALQYKTTSGSSEEQNGKAFRPSGHDSPLPTEITLHCALKVSPASENSDAMQTRRLFCRQPGLGIRGVVELVGLDPSGSVSMPQRISCASQSQSPPASPLKSLHIFRDGSTTLYLNGSVVMSSQRWPAAQSASVSQYVSSGMSKYGIPPSGQSSASAAEASAARQKRVNARRGIVADAGGSVAWRNRGGEIDEASVRIVVHFCLYPSG
jgi:hypothetical protein